ncbi:flavoprotein [Naviculisporaceae sp. PSN 640]
MSSTINATTKPKSIAIITFSTRTPRVGPSVAAYITSILSTSPLLSQNEASQPINLALVDLANFPLPVYSEPYIIPAMLGSPGAPAKFINPIAISWSEEIAKHDAYVLVIPEYNYSMAGGTKNAIDYLMNEWKGKPVMVVSYGVKGGNLAGDQLRGVLKGMGLKVVEKKVELPFSAEGKSEATHGTGTDVFEAMLKGELGENSKREWEEKKGDVEGAFGELVGLLAGEGEKKE